jgi:hypothetical protein
MSSTKRTNIPESNKTKIWSESAGRCQFRACNKVTWYNELTNDPIPFGQMAHIIGASRSGPRGHWKGSVNREDPKNLMLLCPRCHQTIDYGRNIAKYSVTLLREMKKEHEERIRLLLSSERFRTTIIKFTCPIKNQPISFSEESIRNAVLPNYPDKQSDEWYYVNIQSFNYSNEAWSTGKAIIDEEFDIFNRSNKAGKTNDISIFGLAPMPLLIYFGFKFSDTISGQIFHSDRNRSPENRFSWDITKKNIRSDFHVEKRHQFTSKKVLIIFELSDYIEEDKYSAIIDDTTNVYCFTIDNPNPSFLESKLQISDFNFKCREMLNEIQREHGIDCDISILPAMPASLAISFGRLIIPTKDPKMVIYEFLNGKPEAVLTIGD